MPNEVVVSLGSNQGHRLANLQQALQHLQERCLHNARYSIVLETQAILPPNAPAAWDIPYLNMIIAGHTNLDPLPLLQALKEIEQLMGRTPMPKWAPRIIDLDILWWPGREMSSDTLIIPHPELENRLFLKSMMAMLEVGPLDWRLHSQYPDPLASYVTSPNIVGVLNLTPDSFSDGGQYQTTTNALQHAKSLVAQGASVIDIGAQSTRPNAVQVGAEEEWWRLEPILSELPSHLHPAIPLSIDTYHPEVVAYVSNLGLPNPIWINDVTGGSNQSLVRAVAEAGSKLILMHSLAIPPTPDHVLPPYPDIIEQLLKWGEQQLRSLSAQGISAKQIIVDPGIGFGKSPYQSIAVLSNINRLKSLGCEVLVGHSRKSFMRIFTDKPAQERDLETSILSTTLARQSVDYLRVHDVAGTQRALVAYHALNNSLHLV